MVASSKIERNITFGTPDYFSITIGTNLRYQTPFEHTFHDRNNGKFPLMIGNNLDFCSRYEQHWIFVSNRNKTGFLSPMGTHSGFLLTIGTCEEYFFISWNNIIVLVTLGTVLAWIEWQIIMMSIVRAM